jgi:hypothetical protein
LHIFRVYEKISSACRRWNRSIDNQSSLPENLLNKEVEVGFADSKCVGILEGEDESFISVITREGQEMISKHSIKRIIPIYTQPDSN